MVQGLIDRLNRPLVCSSLVWYMPYLPKELEPGSVGVMLLLNPMPCDIYANY